MSVLIIAEHNNQQLSPATLHAVAASAKLGEVHLLVAGKDATSVVETARQVQGTSKVLVSNTPHYAEGLAEELAPLAVKLAGDYRYIAAIATAFGENLIPRITALPGIPQISDLTEAVDASTFVRPIYAGNAFETVQSQSEKVTSTFRATAFNTAALVGDNAKIVTINIIPAQNLSRFVSRNLSQSDRPELTQAKVVVSGGRALGSTENFNSVLTSLADILNTAIGASRAAVDLEYAPDDIQAGQAGKVVAPQLYIAVGISGAIQHVADMQDSKVIAAINKDADTPTFNIADYGSVGDLLEIVPQLVDTLKS